MVFFFLFVQGYEYHEALFSINDTVYGSIFYLLTGCHGFHVFVGTVFLFVCYIRHILLHFTSEHHLGFEAAAIYWHFVDVVWVILFTMLYLV